MLEHSDLEDFAKSQPDPTQDPCPGVNALANHGYLPRNGLNISLDQFITGLNEGLNFDAEFTRFAVSVYQNFTTTGYNNTLNLNDLEHHASKLILCSRILAHNATIGSYN
ncbi:MAG: hypothetical protein Q9213_003150 [Squamulea squamosa]